MSDLVELAETVADRGVSRVGNVVVDGSYFDDQMLPPSFDQQPEEVAAFRAAVSAVAVERSAYVLTVVPGAAGEAARVLLACAGYFDVDNQITTAESGAPNIIAIQSGGGDTMRLALRGTVPANVLGVSYRRRVENPAAYAGHCMAEALRRSGIRVSGTVRLGATPSDASLLTSRRSEPLAEIINAMGKGATISPPRCSPRCSAPSARAPARTARGLERARRCSVAQASRPVTATLVNGSGLFDGNRSLPRISRSCSRTCTRAPRCAPSSSRSSRSEASKARWASRLDDVPRRAIVRAKTGTLNDVIALCGYAIGPNAGRAYAFSVLVNGATSHHTEARALADDIARALARDVNP